jgi:transcriptional regulator with XRE-family HTH domain
MVQSRGVILIQKIKQDNGNIGRNIREIRLARGIGQTELVRLLDLQGIAITRECLVKIERGVQHLYVQQLRGIKDELGTSYEELLK